MAAPIAIDRTDLPIPTDVQPGKGWSTIMLEMAAHVGAYDVLRLCENYGGQQVYFPVDPANAPFADVLGRGKAEALCTIFRRERITIPTARHAIAVAKRGCVIAAVRAGAMTIAEAVAKLGLRRDTIASLVRGSSEGQLCNVAMPVSRIRDPRQLEMFGDQTEDAA